MQRQSTLSTLSLLLLIAACGKAPVPIAGQAPPPPQPSQAAMPADDIHAGLATQGSMPPMPGGAVEGEPHLATSGPSDTYAGVIRLRGSLAEVERAFLFVSVMSSGEKRPACSTKISLADQALGQVSEGERVVPFALVSCNVVESGVELQVWYDLDGFVDTKEEGSIIRRHPIERGDQAIDIVLEPDA